MFEKIHHLDDLLPSLSGRKEFLVARRPEKGYIVCDYNYQLSDTFGNLINATDEESRLIRLRREARGIKFDMDGRIIARPWHKFFNINEKMETQAGVIDWTQPYQLLEKLDGSMVHALDLTGNLTTIDFMTKMDRTPPALAAQKFAEECQKGTFSLAREMLDCGMTPIFEWCSRSHPIVIDYPIAQLVLTGVRNMTTGDYLSYSAMLDLGRVHNVPVVKVWADGSGDITQFLKELKDLRDMEGCVIVFPDGFRVKVKADDYVMRHKTKDKLLQEKDVLALILNDKDDDVIAHLDSSDKTALVDFAQMIRENLAERAREVKIWAEDARARGQNSRKVIAQTLIQDYPVWARPLIFMVLDGNDPFLIVKNLVAKNTSSSTQVNNIRELWGGKLWADYYRAWGK